MSRVMSGWNVCSKQTVLKPDSTWPRHSKKDEGGCERDDVEGWRWVEESGRTRYALNWAEKSFARPHFDVTVATQEQRTIRSLSHNMLGGGSARVEWRWVKSYFCDG
ncbi:hypothetical protein BLNAU_5995 [Blattamonas nauphoetae]|uniref:Uncharacterized protein n=1 Tax=Blattamonas nauphoetae TaxID=2049346 RepID=A0ABQ9Y5I3_9EUKA|nr:hypothetical protein BLNAU_5995 [Blattamonas nauphoetae]